MLPPDVIVSWPKNVDYPLFRKFLKDQKSRFNEIVIVFTEPNIGFDYSDFVKESLFEQRPLCLQSKPLNNAVEDWRNVAIHSALLHSLHSEWILFLEQDFFPQPGFWERVQEAETIGVEAIGVYDGDRLHPCFLLIKRSLLKKTTMNFSANPPLFDHFGKIQKELEAMEVPIARIAPKYWYHMAGLSHNFRLISDGGKPNYKPEEFHDYIRKCMALDPLHPEFVKICNQYLFDNTYE